MKIRAILIFVFVFLSAKNFADNKKLLFLENKLKEIQNLEKVVSSQIKQLKETKSQDNHSINFGIDPAFFKKFNNEVSLGVFAKYRFENQTSSIDSRYQLSYYDTQTYLNNTKYKSLTNSGELTREQFKLFGDVSFISQIFYYNEKEDQVYLTYHDISVGPAGVGYPIIESDKWRILAIFIPRFEFSSHSAIRTGLSDANGNNIYEKRRERGIRNSLQLKTSYVSSTGAFDWNMRVFFQPFYSLTKDKFIIEDNKAKLENEVSFKLNEWFFLSNEVTFSRSLLRKDLQNLPSTDFESTFRVGFTNTF